MSEILAITLIFLIFVAIIVTAVLYLERTGNAFFSCFSNVKYSWHEKVPDSYQKPESFLLEWF
jgi:hypothetical protein